MFKRILIANRGEIACRVARTARRLGIETIAVYSDADRQALHVKSADEAYLLGPAPARESYLNAQKILDIAMAAGADAIHPGYGFLSENAEFARDCTQRGICFVGPPAKAIEEMGSKARAKTIMEQAGVPLIPGYHGDDQSVDVLREAAVSMGFPVLLKAAAGGGGKGMREVRSEAEFEEALDAACRESRASFGDDRMLVEKRLLRPRHVEVQVFFDAHGNGVYLAERDCSIQRRHQKVIEEAPAPGLSVELRHAMGEAALSAASAIGYEGAGTVEFLLDESQAFYFMEMNTRLQVEHPVTELITGIDLVEWQLRVAAGEPLAVSQNDIALNGHAMEARIYAEDTAAGFIPATGRLEQFCPPAESARLRVDTGVESGSEISPYYDPMIAKLIVHGSDREDACRRLSAALAKFLMTGPANNTEFLGRIASSQAFLKAELDTSFIEQHESELLPNSPIDAIEQLKDLAVAASIIVSRRAPSRSSSPWDANDSWRPNLASQEKIELEIDGQPVTVCITHKAHELLVEREGAALTVSGFYADSEQGPFQIALGDQMRAGTLLLGRDVPHKVYWQGRSFEFREVLAEISASASAAGDEEFAAPMHGTVVALLVNAGDEVNAGDGVIVIEAMKMEQTLRAPAAGRVLEYLARPGDLVDRGTRLVAFEASTDGNEQ
ncbi:MAG: acetyl-CoA carboxylase biotin carboxylase subunit [Pseudomonadota bacterium]